jgi:hypothetical protein
MPHALEVPDEVELLAFFGAEPTDRSIDDGYWCYEVTDQRGITLRLSFNIFEQSIQTTMSLGQTPVATVSHESALRMVIRDDRLQCEFSSADSRATLTVENGPNLSVVWSTLRVQ